MMLLLCKAGQSFAQYDSIVKVNRVKYQQIRNDKESFETTKVNLTGETDRNTQATAYYKGDDLKIIEVMRYDASGHKQIEYYFDSGNLFFALERNQPPDEVVVVSKEKNNKKTGIDANPAPTENRYYFYDNKLIRWLDNVKQDVDINTPANAAAGESLVSEAYKMKEKLKK
jgi:hypothetical protein